MLCLIRSLAQILCDDLARAEKATDGKKQTLCYDEANLQDQSDWNWSQTKMLLERDAFTHRDFKRKAFAHSLVLSFLHLKLT